VLGWDQAIGPTSWRSLIISLLATSAPFQVKSDDTPVLKHFLVPFWSFSDLEEIGKHNSLNETEIDQVFYYSGGNLFSFLLGKKAAMDAMDEVFQNIDIDIARLLRTQYGITMINQVDHI